MKIDCKLVIASMSAKDNEASVRCLGGTSFNHLIYLWLSYLNSTCDTILCPSIEDAICIYALRFKEATE